MGTKGKRARSPSLTATLLPASALRFAATGIWLNTGYSYVSSFTDVIPYQFANTFRAIFFGIGTVALFVEMRRWGAGTLLSGEKFAISANVFVQVIFQIRELYLITAISMLLVALLAYVSTSRRIPIVLIALLLPVVAVLHSGKSTMRHRFWEEKEPLPTLTELPGFFEQWFAYGLMRKDDGSDPTSKSLTGRLFERASLFQMLCLVAENTPDSAPYLGGESYIYIPAQLIPSFLWPGKPSSLLSNILLAVHYGLVAADSPTSVSIAFGIVAEAYANFSVVGCAVLGLVLGFVYKRVSTAALGCPQFSALGLFTILLGAWSFQAEQILATWVVSLCQAAIVVIGIPLGFRILFRPQ
jgi:hypothetical protein